MKLPEAPRAGVQSLGREDVNAPARVAFAENQAAEALTGAIGKGAQVVAQLYDARQEHIANERTLAADAELTAMRTRLQEQAAFNLEDEADAEFIGDAIDDMDLSDGMGGTRTQVDNYEIMDKVLASQTERILGNTVEGMSNYQHRLIREKLEPGVRKAEAGMYQSKLRLASTAMRKDITQRAQKLVTAGDLPGALNAVAEAKVFTEAEQQALYDGLSKQNEVESIDRAIFADDNGEQAQMWMNVLQDPEYEGKLTPAERKARINDLRRSTVEKVSYQKKQEFTERARVKGELMVGIEKGTMGERDVLSAWENGFINDEEFVTYNNRAEAATKAAVAAAGNAGLVQSWGAGVGVDPTVAKNRKELDKYLTGVHDLPTLEHWATTTLMVPENLRTKLHVAALKEGNPAHLQEAAETYQRLKDTNPYIITQINGKARDVLDLAGMMMKNGSSPEEAGMMAREMANTPEEVQKQRAAHYKAALKADGADNAESLKDYMGTTDTFTLGWGFGSDVEPPMEMQLNYDSMVSSYYNMTGDLEYARQLAGSRTGAMWGMNSLGGAYSGDEIGEDQPRAMRLSPSMVMGVDDDRLRPGLEKFAEDNGIDYKNIRLQSDAYTQRDRASWGVWVVKNGLFTQKMGADGQPVRWYPGNYLDNQRRVERAVEVQEAEDTRESRFGQQDYDDVTSQPEAPPAVPTGGF